jgi:hypothetical protein
MMIQMDHNKLVQMICDHIIEDGTESTDSGNLTYYADKLVEEFMIPNMKCHYFAESRWTVDDVIDAAKENGIELTPKQAEEWWKKNEKSFHESLIAFGNQMLADADFSEI